jgi:hypothetical protein
MEKLGEVCNKKSMFDAVRLRGNPTALAWLSGCN